MTSALTLIQEEGWSLSATLRFLFLRKSDKMFSKSSKIPFCLSLKIIPSCQTLSKALDNTSGKEWWYRRAPSYKLHALHKESIWSLIILRLQGLPVSIDTSIMLPQYGCFVEQYYITKQFKLPLIVLNLIFIFSLKLALPPAKSTCFCTNSVFLVWNRLPSTLKQS